MSIQYRLTLSGSGQRNSLSLRKAALYSLMFSNLGGSFPGVLGDESLMEQFLHKMEHALGIAGSSTSSSMTMFSSSQNAPLSTSTSAAALSSLSAASMAMSSSESSSVTSLDQTSAVATPDAAEATPQAVASNSTTTSSTSTQTPAVFAHVIVGNTYNYTITNWLNDIALAASNGIDAFALNVGSDAWEPSQVANAYAAAGQYNANRTGISTSGTTGTNNATVAAFKIFLSFDMSALPCSRPSDAQLLQTYIKTYANNTGQMLYNGRVLISTFAGESCTFGASSLNQGWLNAVKPSNGSLPGVWFVPSFFIDPSTFPGLTVIDGAFNWNSAWPMGNYNITFGPDLSYITNLGHRTYMAAVSPWFFTHYGPNSFNKNFIYRGDDWLLAQRWEMLVQNRMLVPLTEVLTWNDFGESHYVGPIEGMQPMSQAWVNGFDHEPWLNLMHHYIAAYKTGSYPPITKDRVFMWGRLYPANATAPDPVGKPANWQWAQDYLWAITLLTAPANVTLSCGTSSQTTRVPAGLSKLKLQLSANCAAKATVVRNSKTALSFSPAGFSFNMHPPSYNYNAFVAASPA